MIQYKINIDITDNIKYFIDDKVMYKKTEDGYEVVNCSSGKTVGIR